MGPNVEFRKGAGGGGGDLSISIGMVGNTGVGKTSLLRRFVRGEVQTPQTAIATIGHDEYTMKVNIDGEPFNIKFLDTAGQEKYNALTKSYFQRHMAFVVVFDMSEANSLDGAMRWIKQI